MIHVRSTVWQDLYGKTRQTILKGGTGLAGVQIALAAMSDASLLDCWDGVAMGPSGTAIAGSYNSVGDECVFTLADAGGNLATVTLPAPDPTIFLADTRTVDSTNALVLAFQTAAFGQLQSANGLQIVAYVSGYRQPTRAGYY